MKLISALYQSRIFRWSRIFSLSFLTLLSVIFLLSYLMLGTQSGTQWLFSIISDYSDDEFTYQQVQGDFFSTINVNELNYHNEDVSLHINKLSWSWQPSDIFQQRLYIEQIKAAGIYFKAKEDTTKTESEIDKDNASTSELLSEAIHLPVDISVNKLELFDLHITTGTDEKPFVIDDISARAEVKASVVSVSKLNINSPEFQLKSDGHVTLQPHIPMEFNTDVQIDIKDIAGLTLKGQIRGDLNTLSFHQSLSGDMNGDFDIQLHNLLSELTWKGSVQIQKIPFKLLDKNIEARNATFDLSLNGEGDLNQALLSPMTIHAAEGSLIANGQIHWANDLKWDLILQTHQLDPSIIYPQWPGNINLKLASQGQQSLSDKVSKDEARLKIKLAIEQLQGTLHDQVLSGGGYLDIQDELIQVQNLHLSSGAARLKMNGQISQTLDLNWDIDIPKMNELIPELSGFLKGSGKFSGTQSQPIASGEITLEKLVYEKLKINQSILNFSLSNEENYAGRLTLIANELLYEDNKIQNLAVAMKGSGKEHTISIKSLIADSSIKLNAKGNYSPSDQRWQGDINQLSVDSKTAGLWQLREPSKLSLSPEQVILDTLCLYDNKAFSCTNAHWQSEELLAEFRAGNLLLEKVKPWLSEDIKELNGEVNIKGKVSLKKTLTGQFNIELTPGIVSYQVDEQKKVRLHHQQGILQVLIDEHKSTMTWRLELDQHDINGDFEIPGSVLDIDPVQTPIQGNIKLNIEELGLLTSFIPQIKDAQGFINADLKISGILSEPRVEGLAEFISQKISIPITGVEYSGVNLKLKSHANNLVDISGQLSSGQGIINVNGQVNLNAKQNWPATLFFKGENFQIVNLPEIQAIISPEVEVQHGIGGVKIKGVMDVPQANVFLKELPEGSKSISEDTIVVGEEAPEPAHIDLDMTVKLGEDIHIKGFGLDAWLKGRMRIKKSPGQLASANGELRTTHGTFRAYGQNLSIDQGRISYAGGYLDDPGINIRASKEVQDVTVGVMATGTAKRLDLSTYSSDYGLTSKDIVALLLTGQKLENANNARIYAGTELTDELSVGVNTGVGDESSEFIVRYKVLKNIHIEGFNSAQKSGANLIYTIEIK